jgi:hypothetical protein
MFARYARYNSAVVEFRLVARSFWVDMRLRDFNGRWIASADTSDGPSVGLGMTAHEALINALQPFEGAIEELLTTLPAHVLRSSDREGASRADAS